MIDHLYREPFEWKMIRKKKRRVLSLHSSMFSHYETFEARRCAIELYYLIIEINIICVVDFFERIRKGRTGCQDCFNVL